MQHSAVDTGWCAVQDVTWMSDHSVHLAKWMPALEQVTPRHLGKCPQNQQSVPNLYFFLKPLAQVAHGGTQPSGIPYWCGHPQVTGQMG